MFYQFNTRYTSVLKDAFPKSMRKKVSRLIDSYSNEKYERLNEIKEYTQFMKYTLSEGDVYIPSRFYLEDITDYEFDSLDEEEKQIVCCIFLINHNGYKREKYLKILLSLDLEEWSLPFLYTIASDYVKEVSQCFYENFNMLNKTRFNDFYLKNLEQVKKGYDRMVSYWNEYYRMDIVRPIVRDGREGIKGYLEDYVGYKLYRECFGYPTRRKKRNRLC